MHEFINSVIMGNKRLGMLCSHIIYIFVIYVFVMYPLFIQ
jgi:hypothetical protein